MSNTHPVDNDGYTCPDKGNRFPLRVYDEASGRHVDAQFCPGCGADLKMHCVREASTPGVEDQPSMTPAPAPAIKEPPAVRQAGMRSRRSRR